MAGPDLAALAAALRAAISSALGLAAFFFSSAMIGLVSLQKAAETTAGVLLVLDQRAQARATPDGHAMLGAVAVLELHPRTLAGRGIDRQHVADLDRGFLLQPA